MSKDPNKQAKKPSKKNKSIVSLLLILMIGAIFPGITLLVVGGMIPTAVVWLMDRTRGKLTTITAGSMNALALSFLLIQLFDNGQTLQAAIKILSNPVYWFFLLAVSGFGWFVAQTMPVFIVGVITARDKNRLNKIRTRQQMLVEEWGEGITEVPNEKKPQ